MANDKRCPYEKDLKLGGYCEKSFMACNADYYSICKIREKCTKQTNADRIRAMSDEELAEFASHYISCGYCDAKTVGGGCGKNCKENLLKWLQSEVEEQ